MTVGDEIGRAAELAAPELGISVTVAKAALWVIGGLLVAAAVVYVIWKVFFAGQQAQQKHDVVQAKGQSAISSAGAQAGAAAVPIIVHNYNTGAAIDAQTQEAIREALKSPGAAQAVDPGLDDIGRRAICMRLSAARLPDCQRLLDPGP